MNTMTRIIAPLGLVAMTALSASAGTFTEPIGLQLYSLRDEFKISVSGGIKKVKAFGFKDVELAGTYDLPPPAFSKMLEDAGLNPVAGHFPFDRFRDDPEGVSRDARALGLGYAGCAWIPHEGAFDENEARKAVAVFNKAGEILKNDGIQFYYHIHGYEFHKHRNGTLLDLIISETDAELVAFELDVLWAVFPGQDPVELLEKHGSRWQLMHVKDLRKGVETGSLSGKTDVTNDVPVGTGQVNWPAVLEAAKKAGVKHYFIEDESPTVLEQIPRSLEYLKKVTW
ncbi:MAG TPA: sugar phosphate isomerase/epimerase [Opitutaceae bacterium]